MSNTLAAATGLLVLLACPSVCTAVGVPSGPYTPEPPIVIWFHAVKTNSLESLQTALASEIPNHVMISYMHRLDADWQASGEALKAIELARQAKAKLIWCRSLWPYYHNKQIDIKAITDPMYYVQEIRLLRAEGQAMKADYVALDLEPYGRSPLKGLFKGPGGLTAQELAAMAKAVKAATDQAGQVDFVLPAGSTNKAHPYNLLSGLGRIRICEGTYYNTPSAKKIPYEYEIVGAHVASRKWQFVGPQKKYFTIQELLDGSQIWSHKKGLFIYTSGMDSPKVAQDLKEYTEALLRRAYANR